MTWCSWVSFHFDLGRLPKRLTETQIKRICNFFLLVEVIIGNLGWKFEGPKWHQWLIVLQFKSYMGWKFIIRIHFWQLEFGFAISVQPNLRFQVPWFFFGKQERWYSSFQHMVLVKNFPTSQLFLAKVLSHFYLSNHQKRQMAWELGY